MLAVIHAFAKSSPYTNWYLFLPLPIRKSFLSSFIKSKTTERIPNLPSPIIVGGLKIMTFRLSFLDNKICSDFNFETPYSSKGSKG